MKEWLLELWVLFVFGLGSKVDVLSFFYPFSPPVSPFSCHTLWQFEKNCCLCHEVMYIIFNILKIQSKLKWVVTYEVCYEESQNFQRIQTLSHTEKGGVLFSNTFLKDWLTDKHHLKHQMLLSMVDSWYMNVFVCKRWSCFKWCFSIPQSCKFGQFRFFFSLLSSRIINRSTPCYTQYTFLWQS